MPVALDPSSQTKPGLSCITCSYDLRGLDTRGLCPECGAPIRDSLQAETDEHRIARALKAIAVSYFIACVPIFGTMICILFRIAGSRDLRFRCDLQHPPATAAAVRWLWIITVSQGIAAGLAIAWWLDQMLGFNWMYVNSSAAHLLLIAACLLEAGYFVSVLRLSVTLMKQRGHQGLLGSLTALGVLTILYWSLALASIFLGLSIEGTPSPCAFVPGLLVWPLIGLTLNDIARQISGEASDQPSQ